jgi:hypothetical protein
MDVRSIFLGEYRLPPHPSRSCRKKGLPVESSKGILVLAVKSGVIELLAKPGGKVQAGIN